MRFRPTYCPHSECPSRSRPTFRWSRKGTFRRRCDKRVVQRYKCLHCLRTFSSQSFRLDYRLRLPHLHLVLARDFVSKTTHRQSARTLGCDRKTVARRLRLLGEHCRRFHEAVLERGRRAGVIGSRYLLDELETHEERRRLQPLTVPMVVEHPSHLVLGCAVGTLPARGNLRPEERRLKERLERIHGRRRNQSRAAVQEALGHLAGLEGGRAGVCIESDFKKSYPGILREVLGPGTVHLQHSSTAPRTRRNPLFAVNHTLAMLRDGVSRLVRRNWGASKRRLRLLDHLWIWIAWRNYVRGITVRAPRVTPAMALGLLACQHSMESLLTWRVAPRA